MVYSDYGPDRETGAVCDYRMYDRIWQRVSPDLNPYPHIRDGGEGEVTLPEAGVPLPVPQEETGLMALQTEGAAPEAAAPQWAAQRSMGTHPPLPAAGVCPAAGVPRRLQDYYTILPRPPATIPRGESVSLAIFPPSLPSPAVHTGPNVV